MNKLFMFTSSDKRDNSGIITVMTRKTNIAFGLALMNFVKHGYKGRPVQICIYIVEHNAS